MSDNFDWQTEDDQEWEEFDTVVEVPADSRKVSARTLIIIVSLLGVAALVLNWQYNRRIEALTATIEMDVLSTHNLIIRAVEEKDLELLAPLLSAKKLSWTLAQEQLMEQSLFYDRAQLDLFLVDTDEGATTLSLDDGRYLGLEVAPDMNEVVLSYVEEYLPGSWEEAVLLEQTAVYRRGRNRWLLSPPSEEFWGEWQTTETDHLILVYPQRDAELAAQLAEDLSQTISQACRTMAADDICSSDVQVRLRLDSDPTSLLEAADLTTLYDGNLRLNLPAPTLIGLPQDDAGYQAILRSYAAPVMSVIITEAVGWECCTQAAVYQALMDYQLAKLGLRTWPVTSATYTEVVNAGLGLDTIFPFWISRSFSLLEGPDSWQIYAFVDFLMRENLPASEIEIMASLNGNQNMQSWLADLFGTDRERGFVIHDRLSRDWWLDAQTQMMVSQRERPISFPDQDLLVTCSDELGENLSTTLYRYSFDSNQWQEIEEKNGFLFSTPAPDDNSLVLGSIDFTSEYWLTELLENGELTLLNNEDYLFALSWGQADPSRENMLVFGSQASEQDLQPLLVNIATCQTGSCEFTPISGVPIWSPDGSHVILAEMAFLENGLIASDDGRSALFDTSLYFNNIPLSLANVADPLEITEQIGGLAEGNLPFWLDDNTYGYITTSSVQSAAQEIRIASVADNEPVTILKTEQLVEAIPEEKRPFRLSIRMVKPHPVDPDLLVVVAISRLEGYLFTIDLENNLVENLLQFGSNTNHFLGFSPDGRYILLTGAPQNGFRGPQDVVAYYLHDITRNKTQTFIAGASSLTASYSFDWSLDGNWLALSMNNGIINLIAPRYEYQYIVRHDFGDCSTLAWVNPAVTRP